MQLGKASAFRQNYREAYVQQVALDMLALLL
jgi:hypothetical protein